MSFSIIHNGYTLDKVESDYINQTLIDNLNNGVSKKKSLIALDEKLTNLKKLRLDQLMQGLIKAESISKAEKVSIYKMPEFYIKLKTELLDEQFWENFFVAIQESGYEYSEHVVPTYLNKTLRLTLEEYNFVFDKDWDLNDKWIERMKHLISSL